MYELNPVVLFSVLKATSTYNQAKLITKLINQKGYEVAYKDVISLADMNRPDVYGAIWFSLATAAHLTHATPAFLMSRKPRIAYVTIEGIPKKGSTMYSNVSKMTFVAVSDFVRKTLRKVGFNVIDVVHHAIDLDLCKKAIEKSSQVRNVLEKRYGNRIMLLYVGRNDPRKGLSKLRAALDMIDESTKSKFVILMKTEDSAKQLFKGCNNVIFIDKFGNRGMLEVLSLMAACDYLIFPSLSEGFGLPVLEANSVGKPAIHCWFEPLAEFSSKEYNFVFDYDEINLVECKLSQYWIFHEYDASYLAEMIKMAIDIYTNSKQEYQEYCKKAVENAKNFDYRIVYPKLLKYINIA